MARIPYSPNISKNYVYIFVLKLYSLFVEEGSYNSTACIILMYGVARKLSAKNLPATQNQETLNVGSLYVWSSQFIPVSDLLQKIRLYATL